jgi:hypothetical protein
VDRKLKTGTYQFTFSSISGQLILLFNNLYINDISFNLRLDVRECKPSVSAKLSTETFNSNLSDKCLKKLY